MKLLWYSRYNQPPHTSLSALSSALGMPAHVIPDISLTSLSSPGMPLDWDSVLCQVPFTVSPFLYLYSYPLIAIWSVTPTSHRYAIKIPLQVKLKFMAPNTWTWKKNIFPPTSFFALRLGILYCCLFFKGISLPLTNQRLRHSKLDSSTPLACFLQSLSLFGVRDTIKSCCFTFY